MTERIDEESRKDLIRYRLERADETLEEASLLANAAHYNAAINRLYYAAFYATLALLLNAGISVKTHAGVKTMLGLHFISKGKLAIEHGKTYNSLFNLRHSNDYDDFVYCDEETVKEFLPRTKEYIHEIKLIIS